MGPLANPRLAAGADGVRVGTRFIAAQEAGADPRYLQALIAAKAEATIYTDLFTVGWPIPNASQPHRVLRSNVMAAEAFQGEYVAENRGESVDGAKKLQPAVEIVQELASDAEKLLRRWNCINSQPKTIST
jgi:NAD(P)H-dependent flavin oxidoreductase YrpB (nitropropane dioxygenase family)